jgi:acyl-CoA thioester hydrolase
MGIVYHTNYIKWFEVGRTELFRDMGIVYADWEGEGINFPLSKAFCHYLSPARYDDVVCVVTELGYIRRASIRFNSSILNEDRNIVLAEGYTIHACTDRSGKIVRLPGKMVELIKNTSSIN